jgi:hypothetical protein
VIALRDANIILAAAAVALRSLAARILNQDTTHRLGRGGKEVGAVLPGGLLITAKPQPCLMHERGWLQRLSGRFARHLGRRQPAKLVVYEHQNLLRGLRVVLIRPAQQQCDVTGVMVRHVHGATGIWGGVGGHAANATRRGVFPPRPRPAPRDRPPVSCVG